MTITNILFEMRENGAEIVQTLYPRKMVTELVDKTGGRVKISSASLDAALKRNAVALLRSEFNTFTKHRYAYKH